jgi:hypothetical protein
LSTCATTQRPCLDKRLTRATTRKKSLKCSSTLQLFILIDSFITSFCNRNEIQKSPCIEIWLFCNARRKERNQSGRWVGSWVRVMISWVVSFWFIYSTVSFSFL